MRKFLSVMKWALIPLFVVATVAVLSLLDTYKHTDKKQLYLTPIFGDARGWEIYTMENGQRTPLTPQELMELEFEQTFYLSRVLTEDLEDGGYTFLRLDSPRPAAVFLDGGLLYTTCPAARLQEDAVSFPAGYTGLSASGESVRLTLPEGFAGKRLTIASVNTDYHAMPSVIFSSEAIETGRLATDASQKMIPATAFAVTALLLLGLWLFGLFQGNRSLPSLLLIAAALTQMFSYLRQYDFISPSSTAMDTPLAVFVPVLVVLLPMLYLLTQMREKRNILLCGCIIGVSAIAALIPPAAGLFGGLPFETPLFTETLYLGLLAVLVFAVLEAVRKNTVFRLFLGGLGVLLGGAVVLYLTSSAGRGYYSGIVDAVLRDAATRYPIPLFEWCGTALLFLSALISIYILIRNTVRTQTELAVQTERSSLLRHDLAAQKQFYEARLSQEEEIRALRHDMKGHLSTLAVLLKNGKTEEAESYLAGIIGQHEEPKTELLSRNPYMNAVLTSYYERCKKNHISFLRHIGIEDQELPATELCLILNNALENALEASMKLPEAEREIKVQAAVRQKRFLLRVSNRYDGKLQKTGGLPVTSKAEKGHGYGLSNIRQAAQLKGGTMEYRTTDGHFVLDVQFPLASE